MENNVAECAYCNFEKDKFHFLPCFHSICNLCLKDITLKSQFPGKFLCPFCQTVIISSTIGPAKHQNFTSEDADNSRQTCTVCEDGIEATLKCLDCEEFYCQKCSIIHLKMKPYRGHKLYSIDFKTKAGTNLTFCKKHKTKELITVCTDCCVAFCSSCSAILHKGHKLQDFKTTIKQMREELTVASKFYFRRKEEFLTKNIDSIEGSRKSLNSVVCDKETAEFEELINDIKDQLDDISKTQMAEIRKAGDCRTFLLEEECVKLLTSLTSLETQERTFYAILNHAGSSELMARYDQMSLILNGISKSDMLWIRKGIRIGHKKDGVRPWLSESSSRPLFETNVPQLKAEFIDFNTALGMSAIVGIVPLSGDKTWVASKKQIQLYEGNKRKDPINFGENVYDLTKDNYGNMFAACESSVRKIDQTGRIVETLPLPRQGPSGIASRDGILYVAFYYPSALLEYSYSTKLWIQRPLVFQPNKIRIHPNGDVCIVNRDSLVIMNSKLEICSTIKLPDVIDSVARSEQGLSVAASGHVFTSDRDKKTIYFTAAGWNSLKAIDNNLGWTSPSAIFVDSSGVIWLGSWVGNVFKGQISRK